MRTLVEANQFNIATLLPYSSGKLSNKVDKVTLFFRVVSTKVVK